MFQFEQNENAPNTASCRIPINLSFFEGHFPEYPILPGAVLIEASLDFVRTCNPNEEKAKSRGFRISNAKFSRPITPGLFLQVACEPVVGEGWKVNWTEADNGNEIATISLTLHRGSFG
jgi:3-hydroxymyristoyl/3-hydroxydecanoyl-(acyl carrier protein) dehydratase